MEILANLFFVIAVVSITYIAVRSMIKILNTAYNRKEISKRNHKLLVPTSVGIGITIAIMLSLGSIKLLEFTI